MKICNCHAHIFTIDHVPDKFLPVSISWLMRNGLMNPLIGALSSLIPFSTKDLLDRYANFVKQGKQASQQKVFDDLAEYYPKDTSFVILSMDMDKMGAGNPKKPYLEQIKELAELKANPAYKDRIIPFVFADARRLNVLDLVKDCIENKGFGGIKLYPSLGYYPFDDRLYGVYEYAVKYNLPIMTHTNKGGVYYRGELGDEHLKPWKLNRELKKTKHKDFAQNFANPANYEIVLKDFPTLKLCFGHFGGDDEWKAYIDARTKDDAKKTWYYQIKELIANPQYPNLFTDISYTISVIGKNKDVDTIDTKLLDVLYLAFQEERVKEKILFGSDFYMANIEGNERKFSVRLRRELGEDLFSQIAEINPQKYLGFNL